MTEYNAVFAQNLTHARAIIAWMRLDPRIWHANEYGGELLEQYERAILVRPVDGIILEHYLWVVRHLAPRMRSTEHITPLHWTYGDLIGFSESDENEPIYS